jgi:hypothetical protein
MAQRIDQCQAGTGLVCQVAAYAQNGCAAVAGPLSGLIAVLLAAVRAVHPRTGRLRRSMHQVDELLDERLLRQKRVGY